VPKYPTQDPDHRILARQRSRYTHYYFYIRDEVLGPMVMRAGSFFPFQTTYYLNGHSFIEQELTRAQVGFRKNDNAERGNRASPLKRRQVAGRRHDNRCYHTGGAGRAPKAQLYLEALTLADRVHRAARRHQGRFRPQELPESLRGSKRSRCSRWSASLGSMILMRLT